MDKQDARKLEPAAQYELRKQVIRAWKRGRNRVQISEEVGLSYVAVCNIVKRYRLSEDQVSEAWPPHGADDAQAKTGRSPTNKRRTSSASSARNGQNS